MEIVRRRLRHTSKNEFQDWLNRPHELGGSVKVRQHDASIEFIPQSSSSARDPRNVRIPSSQVMFHTHPLGCPDEHDHSLCGFSVPSVRDLRQFMKEKEAIGHVIISHDGIYIMENECKGKKRVPRQLYEQSQQMLDDLDRYEQSSTSLSNADDYAQNWWRIYNKYQPSCVNVNYFPYHY